MTFSPEFVLQLVLALGMSGGVYAAIRADLARLHERATQAHDTANKAHERIDHMMQGCKT